MRIVVVSDSHGHTKILNEIYEKEKAKTQLFIHCGDCCDIKTNVKDYLVVRGNCDFLADYPEFLELTLPIGKIYCFHGLGGLGMIKRIIKEKHPDIILYGHTHQRNKMMIENTLVLNPGSVTYPRDFLAPSYLVIEGTSKDNIKIEFIELK